MKRMKSLMLFPLLPLTVMLWNEPQQAASFDKDAHHSATLAETPVVAKTVASASSEIFSATTNSISGEVNEKQLVSYAMSLLGTPYIYAGVSPDGFDCSGFVTHVFDRFDIAVPHSSALQAKEGAFVSRDEAKVGDLVIFTGTNPAVRQPGHVGIIISTEADNIEFVHSSSVGGVKVSKVEGTGYSKRFLEIRRIL
ncbi:C40 family peptidase [Pontibacter toksunensis]|uniref:C40 family peptidase n=1 Tax=Pontibacter toksunensis TaxID=1332631 RepID=A0ABW6BUQ2_9BACT